MISCDKRVSDKGFSGDKAHIRILYRVPTMATEMVASYS